MGVPTVEYPHSGWKVVDPASGSEGCCNYRGRGDEIVGEGVIEIALQKG